MQHPDHTSIVSRKLFSAVYIFCVSMDQCHGLKPSDFLPHSSRRSEGWREVCCVEQPLRRTLDTFCACELTMFWESAIEYWPEDSCCYSWLWEQKAALWIASTDN